MTMSDLTIPVFLNRKLNPVSPATPEDRAAYAARTSKPVEAKEPDADAKAREEIEAERKEKARARIAKMKAKLTIKAVRSAAAKIPAEFLGWDARRCQLYDIRVQRERKLKAARARIALEQSTNPKETNMATKTKAKTAKPKAAKAKAKAAKPMSARAAVEEAAKRGKLPSPPDFSAETHKRWRPMLAEAVKFAKAGDVKSLKALDIKPYSSSPKALARYRDLCVIAIEAQRKAA